MRKLLLPLSLLVLLVLGICLLYTRPPGVSDDLGYWYTAQRVHEEGSQGLNGNFHSLRWPVWGMCWLLQGIFGYNMISYTGEAITYMCAGAAICFLLARMLFRSTPAAWIAGVLFPFHPLLDDICTAPWPDLSEGVWGGATMLCWWRLMQQTDWRRALPWAALTGLCVFIIQANRLTGVFIIPVLGLCTLLYFRRRFGWLVVAGAISAIFYAGEMLFYKYRFNDLLHNLHSNQAGKGVHGTEAVPLLTMPFRFIDSLWGWETPMPAFFILSIAGAIIVWQCRLDSRPGESEQTGTSGDPRILGKVIVVWLCTLYLLYACAPQSLSPWRPIVRDGSRFLAPLTIPFSVLSAATLVWVFRQRWLQRWRAARWVVSHPLPVGAVGVLCLIGVSYTTRELPTLGFLPAYRDYVESVPDGTRVMMPIKMSALTILASSKKAEKLEFVFNDTLPHWSEEEEAELGTVDELWHLRKSLYGPTRTAFMLGKKAPPQGAYLSLFSNDEASWRTTSIITIKRAPEIICHRRRSAADPAPSILAATSPGLAEYLPALPFTWEKGKTKLKSKKFKWPIPPELRGKYCNVRLESASEKSEPYLIDVIFLQGKKELSKMRIRPYCFPNSAADYIPFALPPEADACMVDAKMHDNTKKFTLTSFRMTVEEPLQITAKK